MFRIILAILAMLLAPQAAESAQTPGTLRIEMTEFTFRPAVLRLTSGQPVRLLLVNRGQIAHQFETDYLRKVAVTIVDATMHVESSGLDVVRLEPGTMATIEFVPRLRGRFSFACTIEGHREAGMVGVLEVR
jgi:uncharacterized cupredoxin-like copper-binding protein